MACWKIFHLLPLFHSELNLHFVVVWGFSSHVCLLDGMYPIDIPIIYSMTSLFFTVTWAISWFMAISSLFFRKKIMGLPSLRDEHQSCSPASRQVCGISPLRHLFSDPPPPLCTIPHGSPSSTPRGHPRAKWCSWRRRITGIPKNVKVWWVISRQKYGESHVKAM